MTEDSTEEPQDTRERVFLMGDLHGRFDAVHYYLEKGILDNCTLIQVGDFGLGFDKGMEQKKMRKLSKKLVTHNCQLFVIRGNHEDAVFWNDSEKNSKFNQAYENITLLPDYYTKVINDKRIIFVGGGISVDRWMSHRVEGKSYWSNEPVNEPRFTLSPHDILISHTCPNYFNLHAKNKNSRLMQDAHDNDDNLMDDLTRERDLMDHIVSVTGVKQVFYGHFHNSMNEENEQLGVKGRCIDINELFEIDFDE